MTLSHQHAHLLGERSMNGLSNSLINDNKTRAEYGTQTTKELSKVLTAEHGKGFHTQIYIILSQYLTKTNAEHFTS